MENALKRRFKQGESVYVVDYWGTSNGAMQALAVGAAIVKVNEKDKTFTAILYGDTYRTYSFKDYGRLIFDTFNEAARAAGKLPKPQTTVYQVIGKRVYKKLVKSIYERYTDGAFDLVVEFNKGKEVSTKEIGHSLFLSESDARESKK